MSAPIVQAQYEQLEQIAARFAAAAEQQQALLERVNRQVDVLRAGGWQGRGVAAFLREMDGEVQPAVRQLIEGLQQGHQVSRSVAITMQQAENEASSLFRETTPSGLDVIIGSDLTTMIDPNSSVSGQSSSIKPIEDIVHLLDDILKPIDWISHSSQATKIFDQTLITIGRELNDLFDTRGYIKQMKGMGDFLRNAEKGVGFLSNILDLKDMTRYFNGEITNAEMLRIAISNLVPIPVVNDRISDWAIANMIDPDGYWKGLVPQVE